MATTEDAPDPPESETRCLVAAARTGDEGSFTQLYSRVAPGIHAWACLRIRPRFRPYFEPHDVVQEVWYRAWKGLDGLRDERAFRGWVFQIAKHVLLEGIRKVREEDSRKISGSPSSRLFALQALPDSATQVSAQVRRDEGLRSFVDFVQDMSEEDQQVVVHVGLEGLSREEAAQRMGITKDAVTKRWQRLLERLRANGLPSTLEGLME